MPGCPLRPAQSPQVTAAVCVHECKLTVSMREMLHFIKNRNKKIHSKDAGCE